MSDLRKIAKNLATGALGRLLSTLMGVVVFSLSARHLGPSDFGHYQIVMALLAILGIVANLGTGVITLRDISSVDRDAGKALGNGVALRAIVTLAILLGGVVLMYALNVDDVIVFGTLLGMFGWTAIQVNEVVLTVFQNRLKQHYAVIADISGIGVTLVLVLAVIVLEGRTLSMIGAMIGGNIVTLIIAILLANREIPFRPLFDTDIVVGLIRRGWPIGISAIVTVVIMRLDVLLLGSISSPAETGIYGVALKMFQLSLVLPALMGGFMVGLLMRSERSNSDRYELIGEGVTAAVFSASLLAIILWYSGSDLIRLVGGPEYTRAAEPLLLLGVAAIFAFPATLLRIVATTVDGQIQVLKADIIGLLVAICAYAVLIPMMGAVGAAVGKVIAFLVVCLLALYWVLKELPSAMWRRRARQGVISAGIVILILIGFEHIGLNRLLGTGLGCVSYVMVLYFSGAIPEELVPVWARRSSER